MPMEFFVMLTRLSAACRAAVSAQNVAVAWLLEKVMLEFTILHTTICAIAGIRPKPPFLV